jgi:hypothetical protein
MRATRPTHLILPDFINRTVLGEESRSWSSSLWSCLHSPVTNAINKFYVFFNRAFWYTYVIRTNKMRGFYIDVSIYL